MLKLSYSGDTFHFWMFSDETLTCRPKQDFFPSPNQVVFVPNPNQIICTVSST